MMEAEVIEKVKQQVPSLRFPGFKDAWKGVSLEKATCKTISYGIVQAGEHVEGGMPYIKSIDLNKELSLDRLQRTSIAIAHKYRRSEVRPGDIVFSLRGNIGVSQIVPSAIEVANLTQGTARISVSDDHSNLFVQTALQTEKIIKHVLAVMKGSTFQEISLGDLREVEIHAPTLPEQQKIAAFLGAVDRKIQQLKRKQELLEQYKKGVVQQLFSQELRFKRKDGGEFPEWEEATVDECFQTISTRPYQIQSTEFLSEGPIPVIDQGKSRIAGYTDQMDKVLKNDGVIVYGDHTTEIKYIDFDFVVGADGTKLLRSDKHDLRFLYYNLAYNNIEQEGYKRHFTLLREKTLQLPSLEEQSRIAGFLMALDAKVAGVAQAVAAAQQWKKGLLQQMFV